jgi:hypothetical protein
MPEYDNTRIIETLETGSVDTEDATINTSLGYPVETPTDVSGSRSRGTWYQNTTGVPLYISVVQEVSVDGATISAQLSINDSQSMNIAEEQRLNSATLNDWIAVSGIVPDGYYYREEGNQTSDSELDRWIEYKIGEA